MNISKIVSSKTAAMSAHQSQSNYGSIDTRVPVVGFSDGGGSDVGKLCDAVTSGIFQLNAERKSLEQCQKCLGTPKDSTALRMKIQTAETNVNDIVKRTTSELHKLSAFARGSDKVVKLQISKLTEGFKETVNLCSSTQKSVLEKLRTTYLPSEVALAESGQQEPTSYLQAGQTTAELRRATDSLEFETGLLKEREERIAIIEKNIIDVNQIMNEIGAMVHEQAEDINSIENAIENTREDVLLGAQELEKAAAYQASRRKKNCCLLSVAIVVGLILVVAIVVAL